MDPLITSLLVAAISALAWVAYEYPVAYRETIFFFGQCVCGAAVFVLAGYFLGATRTQSVALVAATEADIKVYAALRHAIDTAQLPWWALGVPGAGMLYLSFLAALPKMGIVKNP